MSDQNENRAAENQNTAHENGNARESMRAALARFAGGVLRAGELRMLAYALSVKTLAALAMIAFAWNYAALADAFALHAYFENALNTAHRWYTGGNVTAWYLPLLNWDAQHYLVLSDYGYSHDYDRTSGRQFYPLYPLLIRAASIFMPPVAAALVLNYVLAAGFCVFLFRLAEHLRCPRPQLAVLIVMTFPTAFFMSAAYSEPLFLFLFMGFAYHFLATGKRGYLI